MSNTRIENLSEADHERWHRFIDGVNAVVNDLWTEGEAGQPVIVVGAQFGDIGKAEDQPTCLVTSNLPVCITPSAIEDMLDFAQGAHEDYHGQRLSGENFVAEPLGMDAVPEEYRERITEAVRRMGIDPETIQFVGIGDTSDMDDLEALFNMPSEDEQVEQPGNPEGHESTEG